MEMFSQALPLVIYPLSTVLMRAIDFVFQEVLGTEESHSPRHSLQPHRSLILHYFATLDSRRPSDLEPISASALEQHARQDHQEEERACGGIQQNP